MLGFSKEIRKKHCKAFGYTCGKCHKNYKNEVTELKQSFQQKKSPRKAKVNVVSAEKPAAAAVDSPVVAERVFFRSCEIWR